MTGRRGDVRAIVVVVPVHDEEQLLDRCLAALAVAVDAAQARGIRCVVRVVLDACTDASAAIAARHGVVTVVVDAAVVGVARAAGVRSGLAEVRGIPWERVWIAGTDGDSVVPPDWLVVQCEAAAAGADVFLGTVTPDFADLTDEQSRIWTATHTRGRPNGNVHGASLGLRASVYTAAGGFSAVAQHEDIDLVTACRARGASVVACDDADVLTSGRSIGRTPGGYAGFIRDQARALAARDRDPAPAA